MKINELVTSVAKHSDSTKQDAKKAITAVFESLGEGLHEEGDSIIIPAFGSFSMKKTAARAGRNPSTGETIQIKEKLTLKFKASKLLQENYK